MDEAEARHGITSKLILCFLRHLDEDAAFATLEQAKPWLDRIEAVGLDSSELGHPPAKFARVFAAAAALGLKRVAHAGEEGPPDYVREALDLLQIDRLDHGNRCARGPGADRAAGARADDADRLPALQPQALRRRPTWRRTRSTRCCAPGLRATINSDDPAYFGGYVNDNYRAAAAGRGLGRDELATLARNSFLGSFLAEAEIAAHLARLDAYVAAA